jgi:hypothetical protein
MESIASDGDISGRCLTGGASSEKGGSIGERLVSRLFLKTFSAGILLAGTEI